MCRLQASGWFFYASASINFYTFVYCYSILHIWYVSFCTPNHASFSPTVAFQMCSCTQGNTYLYIQSTFSNCIVFCCLLVQPHHYLFYVRYNFCRVKFCDMFAPFSPRNLGSTKFPHLWLCFFLYLIILTSLSSQQLPFSVCCLEFLLVNCTGSHSFINS